MSSLIEKIWANLFCLFFTAQILSPMIDGKTIYLEIIVAFFNPLYINWLIKNFRLKISYIVAAFSIILFFLCGHADTGIKFLLIIFEVTCLLYMRKKQLWYFFQYFIVSFLFLVAQQLFLLIDPSVASMIGPTNIAQTVWGQYATATFTSFYAIFEFGLPRTSGLSREAGFFASYMSLLFLEEYCYSQERGISISLKHKIVYIVSYIFSFSKVSIVLLMQLFVIKLRGFFKYLPYGRGVLLFFLLMGLLAYENMDHWMAEENETFIHRFGGYSSLFNMDCLDFLLGVDVSKIGDVYAKYIEFSGLNLFAGSIGFIIQNGFISAVSFFVALYMLGINSLGIVVLLLGTITTSPETMQNFIILQYFILIRYGMFRKS